ncbi:MAG: hypothetical protein PHF89_06015 [Eubacteriales bacterium]|jgi:hypothetical protein|nr:hypothetical protein [Eubacteriales bacterium]
MLDINKMAQIYRNRIEQSEDKKEAADSIIEEVNSLVYAKSTESVSKEFKVVLVKKIAQVPYHGDNPMPVGEVVKLVSYILTNL